MKKRLAETIVRYRAAALALILLAAVWSTLQIGRTNINYDLTRYLADDTMTKKALTVMNSEFGAAAQLRLLFENTDGRTLDGIITRLKEIPGITAVRYDPGTDRKQRDGSEWDLVTLMLGDCDHSALAGSLREMFPGAGIDGAAARQLDVQKSVGAEIPGIMLIAVGVVFAVLLLTSHAWLEPILLLIVFAVSILINMGTNFIFRDVSFITFAVCAILQLALSIDYAIMLLHTWNSFTDSGMGAEDAMAEALARCFMRIASSALTTVAGLFALLFMSFTIGFDIGLVLSKGILISMLGVFLLMPSLALLLKRPLRRTRHRPVRFGGEKLGKAVFRQKKPLAVVLTAAVLAGAFFSFQNEYVFTEPGASAQTDTGKVNGLFGASDPLALLIPGGESDGDYDLQRALAGDLAALKRADGTPVIRNVAAMVTTGAAALRKYSAREVSEMTGINEIMVSLFFAANGFGETVRADRLLQAAGPAAGNSETVSSLQAQLEAARTAFIGSHYHRMLLEPAFSVTDRDFGACMDAILSAIKERYPEDYYITGSHMSSYDIGNAFRSDLLKVNLITLMAILLIVVVSFRSLAVPLLLVFTIEGAIWIGMGASRIAGEPVFFISYLICLSIQMGATIDFGILVCDQYRIFRNGGLDRDKALQETMRSALPTVLTSGIILITAGGIIGRQCSIYYISSIGLLISRGALMSVLLVLTLLPALLALADRRA